MLRCALTLALAGALALPTAAQVQRNFTSKALRGEVVFGTPPELKLNGKPARLAPGARIRDQNNLLLMSGALVGGKAMVNYTTELEGMLLEVWILSPAEAARKPWPTTEKEAQTWQFNVDAQTWTKP
ncbi:MAG TPA: hypothetical protein VET87_25305 [Rubrivivax sp.]|jgi:hypothetical protein|nr:hypothetical protein [Rubrivivax sp.]